jgi:signal transduction histidine kinase
VGLLASTRLVAVALFTLPLAGALGAQDHPRAALPLGLIVVASSVVLAARLLRRHRVPSPAWLLLDLTATTLAAVVAALAGSDPLLEGASFILALHAAALVGTATTRRSRLVPLVTLQLAAYLVAHHADPVSPRTQALCLVAGMTLPAAAVLFFAAGRSMRRLGDRTDAARAATAEEARRDEFQRHRLLLHDQASLLTMLAGVNLPPALHTAAQEQARAAANTIKAFINDPHHAEAERPMTLDGIVHEVIQEFLDLPIVAVTSLAAIECVSTRHATAVRAALRTALYNVRHHADAQHVVIHADHPAGTDTWELSVRDDGRGFDMATTTLGFGLRTQVIDELRAIDVQATVTSYPGDGTTIVMSHIRPVSAFAPRLDAAS